MHEELIGQEASLSLPCDVDATSLLLGFIEELMEAGCSEAEDPEGLENRLKEAVGTIFRHDGVGEACHVVATFEIHDNRIDVRLTCDTHDAANVRQMVVAREA
ncbi:MAG: hypothetical protein IH849_11215 [Acidobacteria bacterium]|nr:hypothetical protein [Acidobacteriota bacterium]